MCKNLLYKVLLSSTLFFCSHLPTYSQFGIGHLKAKFGPTLGFPTIKDAPQGSNAQPGVGLTIGLQWIQPFTKQFGASIGVRYTSKRGDLTSPVSGQINGADGLGINLPFPLPPIPINFSGELDATINNRYVDFPLMAHLNRGLWSFGIGYQFSILVKERFDGDVAITPNIQLGQTLSISQPFNQNDNVRSTESSVVFGISRELTDLLSIGINGTIALNHLLKEPAMQFNNPRNIYGHLMLGIKLYEFREPIKPQE